MLKTINISSMRDLSAEDCSFVEQVIHCAERTSKWGCANHLSRLIDNTPVFLVSETPRLPEYLENWDNHDDRDGNRKKVKPPEELLGFYSRLNCSFLNKQPAIFICPDKIWESTGNIMDFRILTAKVIIHELAHALMDNDGKQFSYVMEIDRELFDSIEEPLANWFVLKYFYFNGEGLNYHYAEEFILSQPMYYKLGYDFFHSDINDNMWYRWRNKKEHFTDSFTNGKAASDWIKKAKDSIHERHASGLKTELENILK